MGYEPTRNGKQLPITDPATSWAARANEPIPEHVKRLHADQHAATHSQRLVLPTKAALPCPHRLGFNCLACYPVQYYHPNNARLP